MTTSRNRVAGSSGPVDAVDAALARITAAEPVTHAFVLVTAARARARGRRLGLRRKSLRGRLAGQALGVKDIIDVAGVPTAFGSTALPARHATRSAEAVTRLERAGAIVVGKTATAEWAIGGARPPEAHRPRNPWATDRSPGDSSSGSAVAVAVGECAIALGSDTAGSIRVPAAFNGIVGFKPSRGAVSRRGVLRLAPTLDSVGVLVGPTMRLADVVGVLVSGGGGRRRQGMSAADLRVGLDRAYFMRGEGVDEGVMCSVDDASRQLERAGAQMIDLSLGPMNESRWAYETIFYSEAAGTRGAAGPDVLARCSEVARAVVERGRRVTASEVAAAQRLRRRLTRCVIGAIEGTDLLLSPTAPRIAPRLVQGVEASAPSLVRDDTFTFPANLLGLPAVSVPCGIADGMPVGLQLIGMPRADEHLAYAGELLLSLIGGIGSPPGGLVRT